MFPITKSARDPAVRDRKSVQDERQKLYTKRLHSVRCQLGTRPGRANQSRFALECAGLPDDKRALPIKTGAAKILRPVEPWGLLREIASLPDIIRSRDLLILRQAQVNFRDGMFERNNPACPSFRIAKSGKLQHRRDVGLIFCAYRLHAVGGGERGSAGIRALSG
jgi:hypothetical protein